jgi:hypothetical protein
LSVSLGTHFRFAEVSPVWGQYDPLRHPHCPLTFTIGVESMTTIDEERENERRTLPEFEAHDNDRAFWVTLSNLNLPVEAWDAVHHLIESGFYPDATTAITQAKLRG